MTSENCSILRIKIFTNAHQIYDFPMALSMLTASEDLDLLQIMIQINISQMEIILPASNSDVNKLTAASRLQASFLPLSLI